MKNEASKVKQTTRQSNTWHVLIIHMEEKWMRLAECFCHVIYTLYRETQHCPHTYSYVTRTMFPVLDFAFPRNLNTCT